MPCQPTQAFLSFLCQAVERQAVRMDGMPVRGTDENDFREFAAARIPKLRRSAYLLCGDVHAADDLVSDVLIKLYRKWRHVTTVEHPDAYLHRMLVNTWMDELRRPWRRER